MIYSDCLRAAAVQSLVFSPLLFSLAASSVQEASAQIDGCFIGTTQAQFPLPSQKLTTELCSLQNGDNPNKNRSVHVVFFFVVLQRRQRFFSAFVLNEHLM